ncbi:DUF669 domain-containing protein [Paenibacillus larvae]|uniref:DUF669 domain-containing protein n=1 Tax=Paenibacillus larvae TaxID=1464 RepID=UPI0028903272|nr:DUF669 domain-containing protein [Paenibacillus larvae]MDT2172781.1 DUF669 domain-containing protein [Paenibacillus larvae]MDT2259625.1 DUF669 domain-containing protein [Paenibacillus larvae]MDT2275139.1 DUF669 domain-containing protein [Paenibacillus larvae]
MANIWAKFDKTIDTKALKEEVKQAAEQGDFPEVPLGTYDVKIEKLEPTVSKSGKPMLTCWMKILDGDYKGQKLFYNQVMHIGFTINIAIEFLRSLDSGLDVEFEDYDQFSDLVLEIHEKIDGVTEYAVEYGKEKDYNTFKIVDVFDAQ